MAMAVSLPPRAANNLISDPVKETDLRPSPEDIPEFADAAGDPAGIVVLGHSVAHEAPAIGMVNQVLERAVLEEASDIHLEVHREALMVRFRLDGLMFDRYVLKRELAAAVLSRIKILAQMNIAERRLPQDGRFTVRRGGDEYDVRVSTVPGVLGEKAVLRLLPKNGRQLTLESIGLEGENREWVERFVLQPYGMLLVTGPTGSGKTTTLYSALRGLDSVVRNTITIEDPVEYELSRVTQIQVHPKIGLTFASGLRSILRQDPDVVMVGEMRDLETLSIGIQAALTGHLVLSTLHCNDAASAAARCIDMGTEPFLFTSATSGIVAQRLVRKICERCKERRDLPEAACRTFGLDRPSAMTFHGRGCSACRETGYRGRTAVFEVLRMTEAVKAAIHRKETSSTIRQIAVQEGMRTLRQDAVRKMLQGVTSAEEVLRAVYCEE